MNVEHKAAWHDLRLGIDVGGTNTDAVILDADDRLVAKAKVPTTPDVSGGIAAAISAVLGDGAIFPERVGRAMLGTTHATNALLERRGLRRVAVVRIGGPATHAVPPLSTWPADLRIAVSAGEAIVDGGIEFDGREIAPLDGDAVARFLEPLAERVDAVAIVSVFAPVSERHELQAALIAQQVLGDVHLSLSHEIGTLGLLERENATVLNAALVGVAEQIVRALERALATRGLAPAMFFAQNDGTLMARDYALQFPVLTISSGPANSIRGAAYLTGTQEALVVDIGGTSTDVGMLVNGFPRESSAAREIGGVATNFRMPDLVSLPLGGGTVVEGDVGRLTVGPRSVGFRLADEALIFGGSTATVTDAAVVCGRATLGEPMHAGRYRRLLRAALAQVDTAIASALDRMKLVRGPAPLIVVGGGSFIVPDEMPGVSNVVRPGHHEVANAVGAAIAAVSGQVDRVVDLRLNGRDRSFEEAYAAACERAIRAGADPDRLELVEREAVPLAYLTHPASRLRVKVAGPLGFL